MTEAQCAGCKRVRTRDAYTSDYVEAEVAVGVIVPVCQGRTLGVPSLSCLSKARAGRCGGCGEALPLHAADVRYPAMCASCRADLDRGRASREAQGAERRISYIDDGTFFGFFGAYDERRACMDAIAVMAGGRVHPDAQSATWGWVSAAPVARTHSTVVVETTAEQHAALNVLSAALKKIVADIRRDAFRRGEDLLGRLATGDATIDDYNDKSTKERT